NPEADTDLQRYAGALFQWEQYPAALRETGGRRVVRNDSASRGSFEGPHPFAHRRRHGSRRCASDQPGTEDKSDRTPYERSDECAAPVRYRTTRHRRWPPMFRTGSRQEATPRGMALPHVATFGCRRTIASPQVSQAVPWAAVLFLQPDLLHHAREHGV